MLPGAACTLELSTSPYPRTQTYDDLVAAGGETQAKHANKMRVETKSYVMQDYDLANFRFKK